MEDTKWLCSMFTHWFCPSLKVVSTSRLPAESFDKSGPRQLIPSPGAIFYYNSMNNEYYTKNDTFVKKKKTYSSSTRFNNSSTRFKSSLFS